MDRSVLYQTHLKFYAKYYINLEKFEDRSSNPWNETPLIPEKKPPRFGFRRSDYIPQPDPVLNVKDSHENQFPSTLTAFRNIDPHLAKEVGIKSPTGYRDEAKMQFIKGMMVHAWQGYRKYAWGHDEVRPISLSRKDWIGDHGLAATIVDSLDTLWIMGMKTEFDEAREFINSTLRFDIVRLILLQMTNSSIGFLSRELFLFSKRISGW